MGSPHGPHSAPSLHVSKSQGNKRSSRKRRWLRILVVLLLLLGALALVVNGPVARWYLDKTIRDELAKEGAIGSLKISGTLLSGFTLREGHFEGTGSIELISFDSIAVSYRLLDVIEHEGKKGIDSLIANKIKVVMVEGEEEEEDEEPFSFKELGEDLRLIREYIVPVKIALTEVDFTMKRKEDGPLRATLDALLHEPETSEIRLTNLETNAIGDEGLREQSVSLHWEAEQLRLTRTQVIPELAVDFLTVDYPIDGLTSLRSTVHALATSLQVFADEKGRVEIELRDESLDLATLKDLDLDLSGSVHKFHLSCENLLEESSSWTGTLVLHATDLTWPEGHLPEVDLNCKLTDELSVKATVGQLLALHANAPRPQGSTPDLTEWLTNLPVTVKLTAPSLPRALDTILPACGSEPLEPGTAPEGTVDIAGSLTLDGDGVPIAGNLKWALANVLYQDAPVPNLTGVAKLEEGTATATLGLDQPIAEGLLNIDFTIDVESLDYAGSLTADIADPSWIVPHIPLEGDDWKPAGPIVTKWRGNGSFDEEGAHAGTLNLKDLTVTAPNDKRTSVAFQGNYQWPGKVSAESLTLKNGDLTLEGAAHWQDDRLTIPSITLTDQNGPLATLEGSAPLSFDALDALEYLGLTGELDLKLDGRDLKLSRLNSLLPLGLEPGYDGTLGFALSLTGTPGSPNLSGTLTATKVSTPGPKELPLVDAKLTFATSDQRLTASGVVSEPAGKLVDISASLPLELKACVEDPDHFNSLPLTATANLNGFALSRLQLFAEDLAKAEGAIDGEVQISGPVGRPEIGGEVTLTLDRYPLPNTPYRAVTNSHLKIGLEGPNLVVKESSINCAGGNLTLSGSVQVIDVEEPVFDLELKADHLLAWRNESFILRTNGTLFIKGPYSGATISGELGFVESLFYKDLELLPISVPTINVPKPSLPKIDKEKAADLSIPEPFDQWALDVVVRTNEPILIRGGNFATGKVTGLVSVKGTLSSPRPSGTVAVQHAWARLPLAGKLNLQQGIITLRPNDPYDPILDVKGTATVDRKNIAINVYGPLSDPRFTLFSDPPLPESEILALLATGTTIADLENTDTATMKGAQLAANWLKDQFQVPGRDSMFQRFLKQLDDVELNIGENDPFSGRKLNSATLKVSNNWFLSAAVDATGNTRGVVIFSVRFR